MKCVDNELIQKYIDGETNVQETAHIEKHLADCPQCARNVEAQRAFAEAVKRGFGSVGKQPVVIPEFVAPDIRKRKFNPKIRYYLYAASAACAGFLILFLHQGQEKTDLCPTPTPPSIQMIYSFDGDFDSNKTVSQQEMKIIVIDANGKIVEYN